MKDPRGPSSNGNADRHIFSAPAPAAACFRPVASPEAKSWRLKAASGAFEKQKKSWGLGFFWAGNLMAGVAWSAVARWGSDDDPVLHCQSDKTAAASWFPHGSVVTGEYKVRTAKNDGRPFRLVVDVPLS